SYAACKRVREDRYGQPGATGGAGPYAAGSRLGELTSNSRESARYRRDSASLGHRPVFEHGARSRVGCFRGEVPAIQRVIVGAYLALVGTGTVQRTVASSVVDAPVAVEVSATALVAR